MHKNQGKAAATVNTTREVALLDLNIFILLFYNKSEPKTCMTVVILSGAALVKLNFIFFRKKMRNDLWDLTVPRKAESKCQKPKKN